jgi:hypothetical protein
MRIKPGAEAQLIDLSSREFTEAQIPGLVAQYIYRMDADPDEYYLVVIFTDRDAYVRNAHSPEQHARYLQYRALLAADPEWHDGEIVLGQAGSMPTT